jgi:phospholipid/cholesterol/gamma-HCH transport system substrate-binding protein
VSAVELDDDMTTIIATLDIKRGIRIPADAEAVIVSTGLMGGKAVELRIKGACSGTDCAKPGSFLQGSVKGLFDSFLDKGEDGTLEKVKSNIGEILQSLGDSLTSPNAENEIAKTYTQLSQLITNLSSITGTLDQSMGKYDQHLQASLKNVEILTGTLARNQDKIALSIAHLESITRQFDDANPGQLVTEAKTAIASMNSTMTEATSTFEQLSIVMKDLQDGKGSMGKLLKDKELYDNMTRTSKNLDLLLQDFRLNPKRYVNVSVFGKKQKTYNVPEDDPAFRE